MKRRRIFFFITLVVPFLILLTIEGSLRLFEYGGDLRLVVEREILGRSFLSINRAVGRLYFTGPRERIPEPPDDFFQPVKPPGTLRIFCVGESTMAGFPYEYNATAPAMLKASLEQRNPGLDIEVINVGLAAVSGAVVKDIMTRLTPFEPDLFIVYVGHNEFYGIFGAASSQGAAHAPWLTDLYLSSLRFRTVLLLRDALQMIFNNAPSDGSDAPLMEGLSGKMTITQDDDLYTTCRRTFRSNLESMIDVAKEAGVPVILSMPVSNLSGIPPFVSRPSPLSGDQEAHIAAILAEARRRFDNRKFDEASAGYRAALSLDSMRARSWYDLGQALQSAGRSREALHAYTKAKDLDALRFRMSSDFGRDLLEVAEHHGVPVARIDSAFMAASPDGIAGSNLFLEHVHPNIQGYALIAKAWENTLVRARLVPQGNGSPVQAEEIPEHSGVTGFDEATGRIRAAFLLHEWPFDEMGAHFEFIPTTKIEEVSLRFIRKEIAWQSARYELAAWFVSRGEFDRARREAFAVSRVLPFSYEPLLRIADYYLMEGRKDLAMEGYRRCAALESNPFAYLQIGRLLLERESMTEAVSALEQSLRSHAETTYQLPNRALASAHYLRGYSLIRLNKTEEGKQSLRHAIILDPSLDDARQLLNDLGG